MMNEYFYPQLGGEYKVLQKYTRTFFNRFDEVVVVVDVLYPDVNAFWGHVQGEPEWRYLIPFKVISQEILSK